MCYVKIKQKGVSHMACVPYSCKECPSSRQKQTVLTSDYSWTKMPGECKSFPPCRASDSGKFPGGSENVKTTIEILESINHHLALLGSVTNSSQVPLHPGTARSWPNRHGVERSQSHNPGVTRSPGTRHPKSTRISCTKALLAWFCCCCCLVLLNARSFFFTLACPYKNVEWEDCPLNHTPTIGTLAAPLNPPKQKGGPPTHSEFHSCGIILQLPVKGGPSHTFLEQVALPACGDQDFIINADPVIRRTRVLSLLPHHLTWWTAIIKHPQHGRRYKVY